MKSIKPGRGPSMMGAAGSVFAGIFGVIWIIAAVSMGAPAFFPLFGLIFAGMAIVNGIYHYKNATGKNRYSVADIVDSAAEPDPLAQHLAVEQEAPAEEEMQPAGAAGMEDGFCPYCGAPAAADFIYCKKCGRRLP